MLLYPTLRLLRSQLRWGGLQPTMHPKPGLASSSGIGLSLPSLFGDSTLYLVCGVGPTALTRAFGCRPVAHACFCPLVFGVVQVEFDQSAAFLAVAVALC